MPNKNGKGPANGGSRTGRGRGTCQSPVESTHQELHESCCGDGRQRVRRLGRGRQNGNSCTHQIQEPSE